MNMITRSQLGAITVKKVETYVEEAPIFPARSVFYVNASNLDEEEVLLSVRMYWGAENRLWYIISRSAMVPGSTPYIQEFTRRELADAAWKRLIDGLDKTFTREGAKFLAE